MINKPRFTSQFSQTVIISTMLSILFNTIGILVLLFIFWKRLKEDYISNMIFTTSFYILVGVALASLLSFYIVPAWWFWVNILGIAAGLTLGIVRYRLKVFETIDALVPGMFFWLSMHFLRNAISVSDIASLIAFAALMILIVLFFVLDNQYKKFAWYKSGRIGFSGLTVLGAFFLARAIVAASFPNVLSFVGKADIIISSIMAFFSFLSVYNLSRRN